MRHLLGGGWREQLLADDALKCPKGLQPCLDWQFLPEAT
jgi:hypothetical protein